MKIYQYKTMRQRSGGTLSLTRTTHGLFRVSLLPWATVIITAALLFCLTASGQERHKKKADSTLDASVIEKAAGTKASVTADGVVRIGWSRDDVLVQVDGMPFPPAAGLGSWAAFMPTEDGAMVMGDTVVFQDEVSPAMDVAFAHGLLVTALHNHFFFDEPKVYFMHIGGSGDPQKLAAGVKAMWDAIKKVRAANPQPATRFGEPIPKPGKIDTERIEQITGLKPKVLDGGVVKVSVGRRGYMHGTGMGGSMGLSTWAAFSGNDELAAIDGDFIMTVEEVQPVLLALRRAGIHVVALHNHMVGGEPFFYFTHYWGTGSTEKLAGGFKSALTAQANARNRDGMSWNFDDTPVGALPSDWKVDATAPKGRSNAWAVQEDAAAPSGNHVLALPKVERFNGDTFNLCWTDRISFRDGEIAVKVKANTGKIDQGGGPIWRVKDGDNYYIARWNPLEDNFRVYYVKDGRRVQLDSARVKADPAKWHTIKIDQRGDSIACYLDGEKLLEVNDKAFTESGGVGLWTKADAATSFDDFSFKPLQ